MVFLGMAISYSAVLLAGGKSRRMGQDKALLPCADTGQFLWKRQLGVLEQLQPRKIFWSGHTREGLPANLKLVEDAVSEAGPIAGIAACLQLLQEDVLVVLAIDLPRMNAAFLQKLLKGCSETCGAAAKDGPYFEPLAAVYPKVMTALTESHLRQERYALQDLLGEGERAGLLRVHKLNDDERPLFKNVNRPGDL